MSRAKPTRSWREHFRRDGRPKSRFASEATADLAAARMGGVSYKCSWPGCGGWHTARRNG